MQVPQKRPTWAAICDREFDELESATEWRQLLLGVVVVAVTACAAWWLLLPVGV